jgi:predicted protein tyrosine phosphatase
MPERFSWILPQKLAVGSFPDGEASVRKLRQADVTAILCLTEPAEKKVPGVVSDNFIWQRVAIPDGYTGGIPEFEHFAKALEILTAWEQQQHRMYVHCFAGIGRSASVCVAYLVHTLGVSLDEALLYVKQRHVWAAPDAHQIRVMRDFFSNRT